jgi:hypothetical protein
MKVKIMSAIAAPLWPAGQQQQPLPQQQQQQQERQEYGFN